MSSHPRRFSGDYRPLSRIAAGNASSTVSLSDPTSGSTGNLAREEVELRFRRLSTDVSSTQKQVRLTKETIKYINSY